VENLEGRGPGEGVPALDRIVFFSDAVFAIAITLLAIDVRLPDLPANQTNESLIVALQGIAPKIYAFVLSFGVIAAFWLAHYRTFRVVVRVDSRLIQLNLLLLFCIAALPFPTSVLARQGDLAVADILYAGLGIAIGLVSALLWRHAVTAHLLAPSVTPEVARYVGRRALVAPVMFAISIPIAFVDPTLAWVAWVAIFPIQALISRRSTVHHPADDPDPSVPDT
jgi:uncharacterized membrane protein